jgi:hypothetical protein
VVHLRAELTEEERRRGREAVRPGEHVVTAGAVELKAALDDARSPAPR